MNEQEKRDLVLKIAFSYLGSFYKWGGDDPSGFDCSGLAVECLQSVGLIGRSNDHTAQSMWDKWRFGLYHIDPKNARGIPVQYKALGGDLVFWANGLDKIIHVEIVLNDELSIGASGGGSKTLTVQDAIRQNAFIKIRPFLSRPNLAGFIAPYGLLQI